jgi:hypothetical protein
MKSPSLTRPPSIFNSPKVARPNLPTQEGALELVVPNLFQTLHDRL